MPWRHLSFSSCGLSAPRRSMPYSFDPAQHDGDGIQRQPAGRSRRPALFVFTREISRQDEAGRAVRPSRKAHRTESRAACLRPFQLYRAPGSFTPFSFFLSSHLSSPARLRLGKKERTRERERKKERKMRNFSAVALALAAAVSVSNANPLTVSIEADSPVSVCVESDKRQTNPPTTLIAGVEAVDTPLIRDARAVIRDNFPDSVYFHQMRSWLFGVAWLNGNETLKGLIDPEVHAIGTMMHDLGWDMRPDSPWTTLERRFEVDGAIGAENFIRAHASAAEWSDSRVQLVWDAIALQGLQTISEYKQLDVATIVGSIAFDYMPTRSPLVSEAAYNSILAEFPNDELVAATNTTFTWFCAHKANTTYDGWTQPFGVAYVPGYSPVGHRTFDQVNMLAGAFNKTS
ncbi:hypothetical protein GGR56DRAFT_117424 [Xylariaceae sp. FL0804]|nr:hypothetical protein GGR56DRAFT_117424 [Xylariaceae sp. FL0804]